MTDTQTPNFDKAEAPSGRLDVSAESAPASDNGAELSRRAFLRTAGTAALATAAIAGVAAHASAAPSPDPNEAKARLDHSNSNFGPTNEPIAQENPESEVTEPTDAGDVPVFWYSMDIAKKRISEGGWARQVNVKDLEISTTLAGVNMRLEAGAYRELHWHAAGEWSIMLNGNARLTAMDNQGKSYVKDITKNDLWFFPAGVPHSIQGLGPDGCEFLLVFDDGSFSEFETTLITDWLAHTPREVVSKNWAGAPESALEPLPTHELYIFPGTLPTQSAEQEAQASAGANGVSPVAFDFPMHTMKPTHESASGSVRIVDTKLFPVSTTVTAAYVIVKPGGMRELHWHQNADEWQYFIQGQARQTLFDNGNKARTMNFRANDVGYIPKTLPHYIENIGTEDLIFLEMFKTDTYMDVSLNNWIRHTPERVILDHLKISRETLAAVPTEELVVVPGPKVS